MATLETSVLQPTAAAIYQRYVDEQSDWRRPHLGASTIGRPCARALWYGFRWAAPPSLTRDGRILRLLRRGQREEQEIVRDLRAAGIEVLDVEPTTGAQFYFSVAGGHVGGSLDAKLNGVPEAPKTTHVGEFKTTNDRGFAKLQKEGVEKAKPEHYKQMQLYMHWSGLTRALYLSVNKNNDDIYTERVRYDREEAERLEHRAIGVVESATPPPRMSEDPAFWVCKSCDYRAICHGTAMPEVNCRTCGHSTPEMQGKDGRWTCARWGGKDIPVAYQRQGCPEHRWIPELVRFAEQVDASGDGGFAFVWYQLPDGRTFKNGTPPDGHSSLEMAAPGFADMLGDEVVEAARGGDLEARLHTPAEGAVVAVSTVHLGPQPVRPTAAGKDWGWLQKKAKPSTEAAA